MANARWIRKHLSFKPDVKRIFDDLDMYREFCVSQGRKFDEAELYNDRSRNYQDFVNSQGGKSVRNHWLEDQKRHDQAQQRK
jgi:hypothetical protein